MGALGSRVGAELVNAALVLALARGPANINGAVLKDIGARVRAARFGRGVEGLVAGQGLVLHVIPLPPCLPGGITPDGALVVREGLGEAERDVTALQLLAEHALDAAGVPRGPADVWALALEIWGGTAG